jgi:hypothetical protein
MQEANKKAWAAAKHISWLLALLAPISMAGCASEAGPHPELPRIGVLSQFSSHNLCSLGVSPEIGVYDAPPGAATYRVQMTFVGGLTGETWQAETPARGTIIPEGALTGYEGPCPPERQTFRYRVEVLALAANGEPVGYGWNFMSTLWLARVAEAERQRLLKGLPATGQLQKFAPPKSFWAPRADEPAFFNY